MTTNGFPESLEGKSCTTCKFLIPIYCHPWNREVGRGAITEKLGYMCTFFDEYIFCETSRINEAICECYTPREVDSD